MLTTVIRALQHVMEVAIYSKKLKMEDSEAIILFIDLYKLVFLGTKFTEKVLQIRVQKSTQTTATKKTTTSVTTKANSEATKGKVSSHELNDEEKKIDNDKQDETEKVAKKATKTEQKNTSIIIPVSKDGVELGAAAAMVKNGVEQEQL